MAHRHAHTAGGSPVSGIAGEAAGAERQANRRRLLAAVALAASYMVAEVVGGLLTGSLALLADAGHMLADVAALAAALLASWVATRPADSRRTYGHTRAEILAALGQGIALVGVALLVVFEALERLGEPHPVDSLPMLAVASGGLGVNLLMLWILEAGRGHSLNVRGAWLHVLSDTLGSLGAMTAGALIWAYGWLWADPAASLAISALILASAWHLLREASDVLMEAAPSHLDVEEIRQALAREPNVLDVHDLHIWTIGSGEVSLSSHVVTQAGADHTRLLHRLHSLLDRSFGIEHTTIQLERAGFAAASPREDVAPDALRGCPRPCDSPVLGD